MKHLAQFSVGTTLRSGSVFGRRQHTFASWHVQQGTPLSVLQELGGWQSGAMVSRYAHLGAQHLAPCNDRLVMQGTNSSQHEPQREAKTACG